MIDITIAQLIQYIFIVAAKLNIELKFYIYIKKSDVFLLLYSIIG
jgi:hypothetical protein